MVLSAFGFLLIIGSLAARDEMLAAAQKKEFRRLLAVWEESHCPPPKGYLPAISPSDAAASLLQQLPQAQKKLRTGASPAVRSASGRFARPDRRNKQTELQTKIPAKGVRAYKTAHSLRRAGIL